MLHASKPFNTADRSKCENETKKETRKRWSVLNDVLNEGEKLDRYLAISSILCQISPRPSEVIFVSILLAWRIARVFKTTDESVKEARARFSGTWRAGRLLRREQGRTV